MNIYRFEVAEDIETFVYEKALIAQIFIVAPDMVSALLELADLLGDSVSDNMKVASLEYLGVAHMAVSTPSVE